MKQKRKVILNIFCSTFFFLAALPSLNVQHANAQNVDNMFPNIVFTRTEYNTWKSYIEADELSEGKIVYSDMIRLLAVRTIRDNIVPSPVANLDVTGAKEKIDDNMKRMQALCFHYAFTQDETCLNKAKEFYLAWAAVNNAKAENSPGETAYTPGIEAYSIIRNCIDATSRASIDAWIRKRANVAKADRVRANNWETIRLQFLLHYGLILNDQAILDSFKSGYEAFIPKNIYPNGTTEDLLGRDAFAYHAYNLLFYARILKAQAAYYGPEYAHAEYIKEHRWGASIQKAVDFWKPFLLYPDKYTHTEFVESEWAPDKTRNDYNKTYKPGETIYVVEEFYYMDKTLYEYIRKYKSNTTLPCWLSALRWK
jgi:hypothetical protein